MLTLLDPTAAGDVAASSSNVAALPPWLVLVVVGVVLVANFARSASRRKRARNASPYAPAPHRAGPPQPGTGRAPAAHRPVPYAGTLLNGVPMKGYDALQGHQTIGFANERMQAEAELKRQLDALDAARRAGQVTAEQYAVHREAIFRNF